MHYLLDLLRNNGPLVILAVAFLETLGLPLPAFPFFVLAGCLVVEKSMSWPPTLVAAIAGTIAADLIWYWLGKRMGRKALNLLCRLSLNPDACVGRSERLFHARSTVTVLTAKLIPGFNTLSPSLAGMLEMKLWRYVVLDAAGSLIWVVGGLSLGVAFGRGVLVHLESVQRTLFLMLAAMLGFYIIFRIGYRGYLTKRYSVPRITADELQQKLASGDGVVLVDLRNNLAYSESPEVLPGARRIPPAEESRLCFIAPDPTKQQAPVWHEYYTIGDVPMWLHWKAALRSGFGAASPQCPNRWPKICSPGAYPEFASLNSSWMHRTASSASLRAITSEILYSLEP
jgi:membrane protein DedA with SNARE-associated domain